MYKPTPSKVKLAFWNSVADQLNQWKLNNKLKVGDQCQITREPLTSQNAQIDHHPEPFIAILEGFLDSENLQLSDVQITSLQVKNRLVLNDEDLEDKWKSWHSERAKYQYLSARGNKKHSDKGYRRMRKPKLKGIH